MILNAQQLAEFRHRIRSELNQILGYAELLCLDQPEPVPGGCFERLSTLQMQTRRILQMSQVILNGDITHDFLLRDRAKREMGGVLAEMEADIASLLNELPTEHLADLRRIQAAFLSLKHALDQPIAGTTLLERGFVAQIATTEPYSATIPSDLRIRGNLLVVDDSEANRQLIERQLVDLGLEVEAVGDAVSALEALNRRRFDCVLLDMILPGMDGPTVLKAIRENADWSGIPVVMLSALDEISEAARCIEIGAEDYIIRPVERTLLRAKLHSTIQRKYLYEDCQRLGQDLESTNEELKRFVMVASHDLQAPLRTLEGNLRTIQHSIAAANSSQAQTLLADSISRCHRMGSLIQDLLLYARLGQLEPDVESIELDWVLSEALANLQEAIANSGVTITREPLPRVNADFKQMLYLLQNLIANAIQYRSTESPLVAIGTDERADSWLIYVRDNGIGIPDDQLQKIFDPFHRLHGDSNPGTGLGLAIAERAVERAGGRIWVSSAPREGSTFFFTLPKSN